MKTRTEIIDSIHTYPDRLAALVAGLDDEQLTTAYMPDDWTVAQNVHHVADAAVNLYSRLKFVLSMPYPTIMPFDQDVWAQMPDATTADLTQSLALIRSIHGRVVRLAQSLTDEQWERKGFHPGNQSEISVTTLIGKIDWHGDAHIEQIKQVLAAA